jgi:hypothetical protein
VDANHQRASQTKWLEWVKNGAYGACAVLSATTTMGYLTTVSGMIPGGVWMAYFLGGALAALMFAALSCFDSAFRNLRVNTLALLALLGVYATAVVLISSLTTASFIGNNVVTRDEIERRIREGSRRFLALKEEVLGSLEAYREALTALEAQLRTEQRYAYEGADGQMPRGSGHIESLMQRAVDDIAAEVKRLDEAIARKQARFEEYGAAIDKHMRQMLENPEREVDDKRQYYERVAAILNRLAVELKTFALEGQLERSMRNLESQIELQLNNGYMLASQTAYLAKVQRIRLPAWQEAFARAKQTIAGLQADNGEAEDKLAVFDTGPVNVYGILLGNLFRKYILFQAQGLFLDGLPMLIIFLGFVERYFIVRARVARIEDYWRATA